MDSTSSPNGPFCGGCGNQILKTTEICPHCGTRAKNFRHSCDVPYSKLPKTMDGYVVSGKKEMVIAIVLSFIAAGFGTIYGGKTKKGLLFFVINIILTIIDAAAWAVNGPIIIPIIALLADLGFFIFCIYDAYRTTKDNNTIWFNFVEQSDGEGAFCPGCGNKILPTAEICTKCGTCVRNNRGLRTVDLPKTVDGRVVSGEKSMTIALLMSVIIPGTGTMYNGKVGKGVIVLVASILLMPILIGLVVWIYGIVDAYNLTEENNNIWHEFCSIE